MSGGPPAAQRPGPRFAEVAVDAPVGPERLFTYAAPPAMSLQSGHAVWVPLGPRRTAGIVFAMSESSPVAEVREVAGLQDEAPALAPHQLALARWLSREARCSLYEAAAPMLPWDYRRRLVGVVALSTAAPEPPPTPRPQGEQRLEQYLRRHGPTPEERLYRVLGPAAATWLRRLLRDGAATREWRWQRPRAGPAHTTYLRLAVPPGEAAMSAKALEASRAARQGALLRYLAEAGVAEATGCRKEFGAAAVAALVAKGMATLVQERRLRDPLAGQPHPPEAPPALTGSQVQASRAIGESIASGTAGRFLLYGPTGSGKSEVYMDALAACATAGRRGLLLVPEISLTPQLVARLEARFPGRVGLLHSGLTAGQQYDAWWRIRRGDFLVVLGSRSAVFAPQPDLGLVVLDEEHHWTYKQSDAAPRYHAREVAARLASLCNATLVLGSATPDVATYRQAEAGALRLLTLPSRVAVAGGAATPAPLARGEVVDMREELKAGVRSIFSRRLREALATTLARGEQAILFLNRRGSASSVLCRDCGHALRCPRCDTALTYHGEGDRLLCHRCGQGYRGARGCPRCGSSRIRHLGVGTQRVVQEVERTFGARALRWDRDATRERGAHQALMSAFAGGEAQVLVGTQMVAQGLHLPRVTLVGVVLADLGLYLPDFRAGERAFQLLCQVAGRAGRGPEGGRVIVQTYSPDHYAVAAGAAQDYMAFYRREVAYRRQHRNPPFSRLARLLFQHTSAARCQEEAERLAGSIRAVCRTRGLAEAEVLGPVPAFPPRLRGRHRWQLILRVLPSPALDMPSLLEMAAVPPGWTVDVDPVGLG